MQKILGGLVALAAMTGAALAEPVALPDDRLDGLTAGAIGPYAIGPYGGVVTLVQRYLVLNIRSVADPDEIPAAAALVWSVVRSGQ